MQLGSKQNRLAKAGRRKSLLAATMLAGLLAAGTAPVASAAPVVENQQIESQEISKSQAESALDYWTPERMKAAKSADALTRGKSASSNGVKVGQPSKIAGEKAEKQAIRKGKPTKNNAVSPVSHIGKVFFTLGGQDYVCSGNAVVSANESTVSTAGHCLNEGPGAFATRWIFAPAYENGNTPYGTYAATELVTTTQWSNDGDITYDTGFAVVSDGSGVSLTDRVGASGVAFNQARGLTYTAFGYPAAYPFNGETLHSCYGSATPDPYGQSQSQGIPCDMTGGSSGGPWFIGSGSNGYQNSVNSFGYNGIRNTMFGPYWGTAIEQAYQDAQN
ncbi:MULTISPECIES: trypsin-like serine peptidase [Glutamicibacter]